MKRILALLSGVFFICLLVMPVWIVAGAGESAGGQDSMPGNRDKTGESLGEPVVRVLDTGTGKVINMFLEEYLVGVVAAEMPAEFELDALKAQAVAARTYIVRRMFLFGAKPDEAHGDAEICTDPTHCQAWHSSDELREKWGLVKYWRYYDKIKTAVRLTRGLVITHGGTLIDPVYHGACGGKGTENSGDVWSRETPYLKGVDCPLEYKAPEHTCTVEMEPEQLIEAVAAKKGITAVPVAAGNAVPVAAISRSPAGRIIKASIYGISVTGTELRQALGLTSTFLAWEISGRTIRITSFGKGHAVGMCQYGANGMALKGNDFRDIITHYYTGVKLQKIKY